jgi:hypothetical protein
MTHSKPSEAQDGRNGPQTVETTPGPVLDLVAIEDLKCELLDSAVCLWDSVDVLAAIDGLVAEVKRLSNLVALYRRDHAVQAAVIDKLDLEIDHLQTGKGYTCACCGGWQPDGVCHACKGVKDAKA